MASATSTIRCTIYGEVAYGVVWSYLVRLRGDGEQARSPLIDSTEALGVLGGEASG
jgi:hypothetical protein